MIQAAWHFRNLALAAGQNRTWKGQIRGWEASEEAAMSQRTTGEVWVEMEGIRQNWVITKVWNGQNLVLN